MNKSKLISSRLTYFVFIKRPINVAILSIEIYGGVYGVENVADGMNH